MRDVIGQRRLLERLGEQAVHGDVAHAYELSGPRSIGKHTAVLLLVTPTPSTLLETIRSRVQPLPFRLVARAEIEHALVERHGAAAARYAAIASGRPGVAFTLASDDASRNARAALEREFYTL